jgi:hypothetical protein
MYFFQFRLNIRHRSEKFNVVSDALSRLLVKKNNSVHEALDLNQDLKHYQFNVKNSKNDQIYAYVITLMKMFEEFKTKLKDDYKKDVK